MSQAGAARDWQRWLEARYVRAETLVRSEPTGEIVYPCRLCGVLRHRDLPHECDQQGFAGLPYDQQPRAQGPG